MERKLRVPSEAVYIIAITLLSLGVAMTAAADFGVSMIVAPPYILSLRFDFISFGRGEYIVQALLFVLFCAVMKGFRLPYLFSFATCIIYGAVLDVWRAVLPLLDPTRTAPGSTDMPVRIALFAAGALLTAFAVALGFNTYLPPQVNDMFVKGVSGRYGISLSKFKTAFDLSFFVLALVMSLAFFGGIRGIGIGTVLVTPVNGTAIGLFDKLFRSRMQPRPLFPRFARLFDCTEKSEKNT